MTHPVRHRADHMRKCVHIFYMQMASRVWVSENHGPSCAICGRGARRSSQTATHRHHYFSSMHFMHCWQSVSNLTMVLGWSCMVFETIVHRIFFFLKTCLAKIQSRHIGLQTQMAIYNGRMVCITVDCGCRFGFHP